MVLSPNRKDAKEINFKIQNTKQRTNLNLNHGKHEEHKGNLIISSCPSCLNKFINHGVFAVNLLCPNISVL